MSENLNKLFSPVLVVESLTAAKSLDVYDSGKVFILNNAAGFIVTLPAVADAGAGWFCKIIVGTQASDPDYVITEVVGTDDNVLVTQINELTDTVGPFSTGHTKITLPSGMAATNTVGDTYDVVCDGSKYFIQGTTAVEDGGVLA